MRDLHSINDIAHRLSIGKTKLYELVQKGELKLVKIDSKSLITEASVVAFMSKLNGGVDADR